jgi:hypothetical protein
LRIEFKRKAVVHLDQHEAPIANASFTDNGSVHTVAINALTIFDVVYAHPLQLRYKGKKYALLAHMQGAVDRSPVTNPCGTGWRPTQVTSSNFGWNKTFSL